jgi:hypothetical protein
MGFWDLLAGADRTIVTRLGDKETVRIDGGAPIDCIFDGAFRHVDIAGGVESYSPADSKGMVILILQEA